MFQIAWAGLADEYDPAMVTINCWGEGPEIAWEVCEAAKALIATMTGQNVTFECNGNREGHGGIFINLTSQTHVPPRTTGLINVPRTGHRQFSGAKP